MTYRLIGKGTTDSNGVAHMDYSTSDGGSTWTDISSNPGYTGVGAGEIDLLASTDNPIGSSSCQSEPYTVWDTLAYFDGIVNNHFNNGTETIVDEGVQLVNTVNDTFFQKNGTQLFIPTNTDFCVEFDLKFNSGTGGCYVGFNKTNSTRWTNLQIAQVTTNNHYKLTVIDGVFTLYKDGTEVNHTTIDFTGVTYCGFCFTDWQNNLDVTLKDFRVYQV